MEPMENSSRRIPHARSLPDDLKQIFASRPPGRDDLPTLQEVRRLCQIGRAGTDDPNCHSQLRQVERYAQYFFCADHHLRWARDTGFGAARLRSLVLQLLTALELRQLRGEAQGVLADVVAPARSDGVTQPHRH